MNILEPEKQESKLFEDPDADEEEEDNTRFIYEWTKWMNPDQIKPFLNKFTCVKIPIGSFERCFFYYRQYPEDFKIFDSQFFSNEKSIYDIHSSSKGVRLDQGKIEVKKFENPFKKFNQKSEKQKFQKTSKKILDRIPFNRTMLVINFDSEWSEKDIRNFFGVMGKIRRIFKGKLKKKKRTKSG